MVRWFLRFHLPNLLYDCLPYGDRGGTQRARQGASVLDFLVVTEWILRPSPTDAATRAAHRIVLLGLTPRVRPTAGAARDDLERGYVAQLR
jgi:hypothetical protein